MSDPDKWYRSTVPELQVGAEAGDPDAMYHLALRYRKGREVPQDIPHAVEWLLRAADLGHAHAQSSMGVRYYYGEGVPKNHRLAMKWYLSGAAKKEPEALYNVGDLFDDSDEIPKNPVECCAWMLVAAAYGYRSALDRLDPLVAEMSAENLDLTARRGAQIHARCESGESLDATASFREAKPASHVPYGPNETPPTRLSLLMEFAYRCDVQSIDNFLMNELINGETRLFVRGEYGDDSDPEAPKPDPRNVMIKFQCMEKLVDGSYALLAFTDYQKLCAYQKPGPCLQTPACKLVEMMEQLKTTRFIVNSGTPACYTISKRQSEG
jgi:hypothetical protein